MLLIISSFYIITGFISNIYIGFAVYLFVYIIFTASFNHKLVLKILKRKF